MIIAAVAMSITVFAQDATYEQISTKKVKGKISSYTALDGTVYNIGDEIRIGTPSGHKNFESILEQQGLAVPKAKASAAGSIVTIKSMKGYMRGVHITTTKPINSMFALSAVNLEASLALGELASTKMTSDEALTELKKQKDLLDLGIITEEDYEAQKSELMEFL